MIQYALSTPKQFLFQEPGRYNWWFPSFRQVKGYFNCKRRQAKKITLTLLKGFNSCTLCRRIGGRKLFHAYVIVPY